MRSNGTSVRSSATNAPDASSRSSDELSARAHRFAASSRSARRLSSSRSASASSTRRCTFARSTSTRLTSQPTSSAITKPENTWKTKKSIRKWPWIVAARRCSNHAATGIAANAVTMPPRMP